MQHLKINHMTSIDIDILSPQRLQVLLILTGVLNTQFLQEKKKKTITNKRQVCSTHHFWQCPFNSGVSWRGSFLDTFFSVIFLKSL